MHRTKKQLVQKPVTKQRLHLNSRCWHFCEKTSVKISEKLPLRFPVCNFKRRFSSIKIKNGNRQKRATASRQEFVLLMEGAGKIPEKIQLYKRVLQKKDICPERQISNLFRISDMSHRYAYEVPHSTLAYRSLIHIQHHRMLLPVQHLCRGNSHNSSTPFHIHHNHRKYYKCR